jgi:apolipoprotein N-acyltransferase
VAQFKCAPDAPVTKKGAVFSATTALIIISGLYLWGWHQVNSYKDSAETLKVSLVQGNIPQGEKWDARFKQKIMDKYRELTLMAAADRPDLIVWPETATPGYIRQDILIFKNMRELMQEIQIPLLFGSASHAKIKREGKKIDKLVNSAILMNSSGKMVSSYNKLRLLPFGEYLPMEGRFPWPEWLVPKNGYFIPGKIATVFEMPQAKFGVVICWENLFPELFRRFVVNGSQFMINLTNEAWFGKSSASRQFLSMSVFRAVENRVPLIRCANSGISCLIDPLGRIVAKVEDDRGNDIMIDGVLTTSVPKSRTTTFYTKHGDVFVFSCIVLGVLFVISALLPKRLRRFGASDSAQDQL